jgi:hypothetical protein
MIREIISRGVESMPPLIPVEWDERTVLRLEDETMTVSFRGGKVSFVEGGDPEAESVIQMTKKRLCDIIDGSIDFMTVWRELAEPSPTDRRFILKGSGAKLITLIDLLSRSCKSNPEFKKLLAEYKNSLSS